MESYLSKKSKKSLMDIIDHIKNSEEYIHCNKLKKEMEKDQELMNLLTKVKNLQKRYIRNNSDQTLKKELDQQLELLNNHKLYALYNYYLEKINVQIELIKTELNDYFNKIVNEDL